MTQVRAVAVHVEPEIPSEFESAQAGFLEVLLAEKQI